jgi:hypothetical protein
MTICSCGSGYFFVGGCTGTGDGAVMSIGSVMLPDDEDGTAPGGGGAAPKPAPP